MLTEIVYARERHEYSVTVSGDQHSDNNRSFVVALGRRFRIEPPNPRKLRNRGRTGTVVSFAWSGSKNVPPEANKRGEHDGTYTGYFGPDQVVLKFDDNGRRGRAEFNELFEVDAEEHP